MTKDNTNNKTNVHGVADPYGDSIAAAVERRRMADAAAKGFDSYATRVLMHKEPAITAEALTRFVALANNNCTFTETTDAARYAIHSVAGNEVGYRPGLLSMLALLATTKDLAANTQRIAIPAIENIQLCALPRGTIDAPAAVSARITSPLAALESVIEAFTTLCQLQEALDLAIGQLHGQIAGLCVEYARQLPDATSLLETIDSYALDLNFQPVAEGSA